MSENTKKILVHIGSIFLTALASAVIAGLQEYIKNYSGVHLPPANPENAAAIGAVVRAGYLGIKAS